MQIHEAQREVRYRYAGGFYGQLVSGLIWLASAALATWSGARLAIEELIICGFFIFPLTELLIALSGRSTKLSPENSLKSLGMQVAFVLPLSMPLLVPVTRYNLNLFYPALMILLGAHYIPFVFMYGMRLFGALAALLVGGGVLMTLYLPTSFPVGAWYTAGVLLVFSAAALVSAKRESPPHLRNR